MDASQIEIAMALQAYDFAHDRLNRFLRDIGNTVMVMKTYTVTKNIQDEYIGLLAEDTEAWTNYQQVMLTYNNTKPTIN